MKATCHLESQGQALSARFKCSSPQKPLTPWRAKGRCHQWCQNAVHHKDHSLPGGPKTCAISRLRIQFTTYGTHKLKSQGQVSSPGSKWCSHRSHSPTGEPRTGVVSMDQMYHYISYSLSGEPRTCIISWLQMQLTTEVTYSLEHQRQVSSTGSKCSSP